MSQLDIEKKDRRVKWWLLIISILTIAALISAALRENIFPEWRSIRTNYARLLREKAVNKHGETIANQFEVSIHQNVLPELGIIDRCITCHPGVDDPRMKNEKIPFQTHPGNYLKNHPPEKFGCTLCHRGQGRALEFADAKGISGNWDYPLLPPKYIQAECGRCHIQMHYTPPSVIEKGNLLVKKAGCTECHQSNGKQDLSSIGLRLLDRKWWTGHPNYGSDPSSNRKALADLSKDKKDLLQDFLLSKHGARTLALGQRLYIRQGCGGCHEIRGSGGVMGPDLSNEGKKIKREFSFIHIEGERNVPNWLYEHFLDPAKVVPDSQMPKFEITSEEAHALTTYMLSLYGDPNLPKTYIPAEVRKAKLSTPTGAELYGKYCQACHGKNGEGSAYTTFNKGVPAIFNPDFLRIAPSPFIREIVKLGIPDRDMPSWKEGLDILSLEKILALLEEQRPQPEPFEVIDEIPSTPQQGEKVFTQKCAACHGKSGEGDVGPRLNSQTLLQIADNKFLYLTIVQGRPHTSMPSWADLPKEDLSGLLSLFDKWRKDLITGSTTIQEGVPQEGRRVYAIHCARCHGEKGEGKFAVALHNSVLLDTATPEYLATSLNRCREGASKLPPPRLDQTDLSNVVAYLRSWRGAPIPVPPPLYRPLLGGDADNGRILYNKICIDCHGTKGNDGFATAIGNPNLMQMVSDGYLFSATVIGRRDTVMDAFGLNETLSPQEIIDIITYLRSLQLNAETQPDQPHP